METISLILDEGFAGHGPQPVTASQSILKSMPLNSLPFIIFCAPGQFRLPGQHHRAASRRSGAAFFARTETISS